MKKLLLILVIGTLVYLMYSTVTAGTKILKFEIPSYKELQNENKKLVANFAMIAAVLTSIPISKKI